MDDTSNSEGSQTCPPCGDDMDSTDVYDETGTEIQICESCGWVDPPGRAWMLEVAGIDV